MTTSDSMFVGSCFIRGILDDIKANPVKELNTGGKDYRLIRSGSNTEYTVNADGVSVVLRDIDANVEICEAHSRTIIRDLDIKVVRQNKQKAKDTLMEEFGAVIKFFSIRV